ncbi:MAG TPA: hypothetical protein VJH95_06160 [Candidatus Nanoarchaeia archaeon]|nr:hypothetical protein [Candidatus Nanoarchaeia archaeon]
MGKEKYQKEIAELFKNSPVVSFSSIARIVKKTKNTGQYQKQLIRNMVLKGKIKKLAKGYYTRYSDPSLIVFCFKPSYLGLQNSLSFHNLWEQETIPVILTASKIRQGVREVMGVNVLLRRMEKKYLFGFDYYKDGDFWLPYSDKEKTLIDMVYFKERLSKEAIKSFAKAINKNKLMQYLKHYPKRIKRAVLGYVNI